MGKFGPWRVWLGTVRVGSSECTLMAPGGTSSTIGLSNVSLFFLALSGAGGAWAAVVANKSILYGSERTRRVALANRFSETSLRAGTPSD